MIAAGGTGGHFYPGLVLSRTLRERGWQPLMLVRQGEAALKTLEAEGIAACEIDLAGMPRRPGLKLLAFFWKLLKSLRLINNILRDFGPRAVVGMGGYLSFPLLMSAALKGLPRAVHESNAVLGLSNRLSRAMGAELFQGLPAGLGGLLTGTPIRPALCRRIPAGEARSRLGLEPSRKTVLVFGGSQGARAINRELPEALKRAAQSDPGSIQVLHLAGTKGAEEAQKAYQDALLKAKVLPYLEEMELAYAAAELVVCRAGASTLAELCAQRKPAVLIPYPSATAGHQEANARLLEDAGAAILLREEEMGRLASLLSDLLFSEKAEEKRRSMAEAYEGLGLPPPQEAAQRLADAVEEIAQKE